MPWQRRMVWEESMNQGPFGVPYRSLTPGTEVCSSSSGVKATSNIKKGYTFSKSRNCRHWNCHLLGTRGRIEALLGTWGPFAVPLPAHLSPIGTPERSSCCPRTMVGCSDLSTGMGLSRVFRWLGWDKNWLAEAEASKNRDPRRDAEGGWGWRQPAG